MSKKNEKIDIIKNAIEELRPYLNMDGGDVEFVKYENKNVYIKLTGACSHCLYSDETIQNGIFETIKDKLPEIEKIINIEEN